MKNIGCFLCLLLAPLVLVSNLHAADDTVVITAEGLVDPAADIYEQNEDLMLQDLRNDARKQVIEKAVSMYIDDTTLKANYLLVNDMVLTRSPTLIKSIIEESAPQRGGDGFMHMKIKAEVYTAKTKEALKTLSEKNRTIKLKEAGNPRISLAITVKDAQRDSGTPPIRSEVAENVFKKQMASFGYRVWSEEAARDINQGMAQRSEAKGNKTLAAYYTTNSASDFRVIGSVKFQPVVITMKASGIKIKKYALNSWTVKCYDTLTGEELYFNNKIPEARSWASEDLALNDIGQMISNEFSADFFEQHLSSPVTTYQLMVEGLSSWDMGELLQEELVGLRSILNVDFRSFDIDGIALYEIQFSGNRNNFSRAINKEILKPLNRKIGDRGFKLASVRGTVVRLIFNSDRDEDSIIADFENGAPSSLTKAPKERIAELSQSDNAQKAIAKVNPQAIKLIALAHPKTDQQSTADHADEIAAHAIDFGNYSALLIGNNKYRSIESLNTPISDIKAIAEVLSSKYGFEITLLSDATRYEILSELNKLRSSLKRDDNLLIYYAGHGWLDENTDEGYWLPVDSERNNPANWLANSSITNILKSMEAKHVMIVSDSCYSGTLTRGITISIRKPSYFKRMAFKRSRTIIASGGLEPVMDAGGMKNHSVFATAFMEVLGKNEADYIETTQLFPKIRRTVVLKSDQTPEYSDVRKAGHDGGEFIFKKKK